MNQILQNVLDWQRKESAPPSGLTNDIKHALDEALGCIQAGDYHTAVNWLEGLKTVIEDARPLLDCRGQAIRMGIRHMEMTKTICQAEIVAASNNRDQTGAADFIREKVREIQDIDRFIAQAIQNDIEYLERS